MARPHKPRMATQATPGFYLLKLVGRGWAVGAKIVENGDHFTIYIDGVSQGVWSANQIETAVYEWITANNHAHPIARLLMYGEACDEATYEHRLAIKEWKSAGRFGFVESMAVMLPRRGL